CVGRDARGGHGLGLFADRETRREMLLRDAEERKALLHGGEEDGRRLLLQGGREEVGLRGPLCAGTAAARRRGTERRRRRAPRRSTPSAGAGSEGRARCGIPRSRRPSG